MQTLKTAAVVIGLLAVLYVAYQTLNNQPIALPIQLGAGGSWSPSPGAESPSADFSVEAPPLGALEASADVNHSNSATTFPSAGTLANQMGESFPTQHSAATDPGSSPPINFPDSRVAPPTSTANSASNLPSDSADVVTSAIPSAANIAASYTTSEPDGSPHEVSSAASHGDAGPASHVASRYASPAVAKYAFEQAWQNAEDSIHEGALARALLTLSDFYLEPQLDEATHQKLNERLDQLAGTVIYSKRHLLEKPYKVMRGEKMEEIAARYNVSTRLLQNINGIADPSLLLPGTELKVLRGPLNAEIQLARNEMTIYLGRLYAGRFSVQAGAEPTPRPGEYDVLDIQPGRPYYSSSGQMIPAGNPANPYGEWWIDLGREVSIHGSPEGSEGASPTGCIILSSRDAADVAAILAVGSRVVIH